MSTERKNLDTLDIDDRPDGGGLVPKNRSSKKYACPIQQHHVQYGLHQTIIYTTQRQKFMTARREKTIVALSHQ